MPTRDEVLRALRFRDELTTRDVAQILDYIDQEVGGVGGIGNIGQSFAIEQNSFQSIVCLSPIR